MQLHPRSGLALKHGITLLNAPGTGDGSYRGAISIILYNTDRFSKFSVKRSDRIAQAIVVPVPRVQWQEVDALDETERGPGGFGHTGV